MNENVRKQNKKKNPRKKLEIKLSTGFIKSHKSEKPKISMTTKGSFVQEFKKIRKEIEEELKREDMKYKSRVHSSNMSPKNMVSSMVSKPESNLLSETNFGGTGNKKSIKKFMKKQKQKIKKEKIQEQRQEIKKHIKVKQNLKLLNKYVNQIRAHSSGVYYNRNAGIYERRKTFSNKLYKDFMKSKTPKYSDFSGINFQNLLIKGNPTSDPNLRGVREEERKHEKINVEIGERSATDFYLEYFKILNKKNKKRSNSKHDEKVDSFLELNKNLKPILQEIKASPELSQNKSNKTDSGKK